MDETGGQAAWTPSAAVPTSSLAWNQQRPYRSPRYAGFWRRFLASSIDGLLLGIASYLLNYLLAASMVDRFVDSDGSAVSVLRALSVWMATSFVSSMLLDWIYHAGMQSSSWQATLGKRALGIAVTDLMGGRISFARATGRHFAQIISGIPLGIGYLIQPFTQKRQALHDMIAGTLVVRV